MFNRKLRFSAFVWLVLIFNGYLFCQTRIIPHLTRPESDFSTTVILENLSGGSDDYVLQPYAEDGSALPEVRGSLAAGTVMSVAATELFPGEPAASHFTIVSDVVGASVTYVADVPPSSPAHVGETNIQASRYRLFAGNWGFIFDGFAVVNTGTQAADVWVAQKPVSGDFEDFSDRQTQLAIRNLEPNAKGLYVIGAPVFSEFVPRDDVYYEVYSDTSLAITALRGSDASSGINVLWNNEPTVQSMAVTTRDDKGLWFIEGGSLYDVMEAMGYNVAVDRMFQLELHRRSSIGTLSEYFGQPALSQDIFARQTAYSEAELQTFFEELEPDARVAVQAYVDGINRRIGEVLNERALIPAEFIFLVQFGIIPNDPSGVNIIDKWTPIHVMAIVASLLRQFDPNGFGQGQLDNAALLEELQNRFPEQAGAMFQDLRWVTDPDAQTMIPGEPPAKTAGKSSPPVGRLRGDVNFRELGGAMKDLLDDRREFLEEISIYYKMGSYAWAVSGDKTASGNPIIYSGPQMGFSAPAIVVEGSIRGGGMNISGMSVPGVPGIIIGRTPHHAWSMQVGQAHTADLYIEPGLGEPHRYERFNVVPPVNCQAVFGNPDCEVPVYRTAHGPVVLRDPAVVAWKYAHWGNEFRTVQAFLDMARAQNIDEFGAALENVGVSQHFCYADREGNIAYWMSGRNPQRPDGDYRVPQGSLATQDGTPIVLEYDENTRIPLPHDRNHSRGFYGGWNNQTRSDYPNLPYGPYSNEGPFHRAHAVTDLLTELVQDSDVTYEELRGIAVDIAATDSIDGGGNPWLIVGESFRNAVMANPNESRIDALEILDGWDGHFPEGGFQPFISGENRSDGWVLMDSWVRQVLFNTFEEVSFLGNTNAFNTMLHGIGSDTAIVNQYDWFSNSDEARPQSFEAIVVASLDQVQASLGERPWGIGQRGVIEFHHPLLTQFAGPFHTTPFGRRSTYAHCVEVGPEGPVRIESVFPLGQSGYAFFDSNQPLGIGFHPNTISMAEFFDNFTLRPFPLFQ